MRLVDLTDSTTFDRYYEKGTNIWQLEHPTTGIRAVWIQGQGPQPFHTTADKRKEVRVHYVRALELNAARHRARVLTQAIGLTVADRVAIVGAGLGHIDQRRAIGVDAEVMKLGGHQPGSGESGAFGGFRVAGIELAETARGGHFAPMGRAQALNAAPLLIDEDQNLVAAHRLLEGRDEAADLVRALDIAGK